MFISAGQVPLAEGTYANQKSGWSQSLRAIVKCVKDQGPFDGVLGFSQVSLILISSHCIQFPESFALLTLASRNHF